jgi:hypothetical protein
MNNLVFSEIDGSLITEGSTLFGVTVERAREETGEWHATPTAAACHRCPTHHEAPARSADVPLGNRQRSSLMRAGFWPLDPNDGD